MIDQCDPSIVAWSSNGDSFTIKDTHALEKEVLPKYFNHSKFSSFIRQLNFYGFQKMRSDPDLQMRTEAVRFRHEFFRRGEPQLLHRISRATAKMPDETSNEQVDALKQELASLQQKLDDSTHQMEKNLVEARQAIERSYLIRIQKLEEALGELIGSLLLQKTLPTQTQSSLVFSGLNHSINPIFMGKQTTI